MAQLPGRTGGRRLGGAGVWPELTSGANGLSWRQLVVQLVVTLLPLPVAAAVGWRRIGFVRPAHLHLALFPAATVAFGYTAGLDAATVSGVALAIAVVCLVAVGEEIAFRGVLLQLLLPWGTRGAVAVSSALFGLTHTVNLLLGAPPAGVALQVLFSSLGATAYAALTLRTGSLWPAIVLHATYDLAFRVGNVEPGSWHANLYYTLHGIGGLVFAMVLLRRGRRASAPEPATNPGVAAP